MRHRELVKTNMPGMVKDPRQGVILNTDMSGYLHILALRQASKREQEFRTVIDGLLARIENLENAR